MKHSHQNVLSATQCKAFTKAQPVFRQVGLAGRTPIASLLALIERGPDREAITNRLRASETNDTGNIKNLIETVSTSDPQKAPFAQEYASASAGMEQLLQRYKAFKSCSETVALYANITLAYCGRSLNRLTELHLKKGEMPSNAKSMARAEVLKHLQALQIEGINLTGNFAICNVNW